MKPEHLLLCTDMDRTIIPNGPQPETSGARQWFRQLCDDDRICLVYATGRDKGLVQQAIAEYQLPPPDFAMTDVGSMIYRVTGSDWQPVEQWQREIAPDWRGHQPADLAQALAGVKPLRLQEQAKQQAFKLSYYLDLNCPTAAVTAEMETLLTELGVAANLIWSVDEAAHTGLLDVLPRSADKLNALKFMTRYLGASHRQVLFAGDSGNDLTVLESAFPAVLVANGHAEVRAQALASAARLGLSNRLFVAGPEAWPGNGNYCSGVLQGICHFYPQWQETIQRIVS